MDIDGFIHNGVVILTGGPALPEGTRVTVSVLLPESKEADKVKKRIAVPLVPSLNPREIPMTAERVAELLEEADVSS